MKELLNTETKRLLELTGDRKWAAGYGLYSKLFHTKTQPGQNLTGNTLEELRTEFRDRQNADKPTAAGGGIQHSPPPTVARSPHTPKNRDTQIEHLVRTSPVTEV